MDELYPEAEKAIKLCTKWAEEVRRTSKLLQNCRFYLFGSSIYESGEQFHPLQSDLDIVCLLASDSSAIDRFELLKDLGVYKRQLELQMIPVFHRVSCDEPGVSIVVVTPFEVASNIHKSGARGFFDANLFLDLQNGEMRLSLPHAGERDVGDSQRQAIEFCQKIRNSYLAIAANDDGGINEFNGQTPLPKSLMRSAAQISPHAQDGQWYDTRLGLEYLRDILGQRSEESPNLSALKKKVSIRCGGNGARKPLTAEDQVLFAELLFDTAYKDGSVESVYWFMRIVGVDYSESTAKQLFEKVQKLVPQVRYRGGQPGSVIINLLSPLDTFNFFKTLQELNALDKVLGLDVKEIALVGEVARPISSDVRITKLVDFLQRWVPPASSNGRLVEDHFENYLVEMRLEKEALSGGIVERNVRLDVSEIPYSIDFLVSWPQDEGTRVGIDVAVLRKKQTFYHKVSQVVQVGGPLVLVLVTSCELAEALRDDIARLRHLKPNIYISIFTPPV